MEGIIITHYGINIDLDSENRQITEAWDTIQRTVSYYLLKFSMNNIIFLQECWNMISIYFLNFGP